MVALSPSSLMISPIRLSAPTRISSYMAAPDMLSAMTTGPDTLRTYLQGSGAPLSNMQRACIHGFASRSTNTSFDCIEGGLQTSSINKTLQCIPGLLLRSFRVPGHLAEVAKIAGSTLFQRSSMCRAIQTDAQLVRSRVCRPNVQPVCTDAVKGQQDVLSRGQRPRSRKPWAIALKPYTESCISWLTVNAFS